MSMSSPTMTCRVQGVGSGAATTLQILCMLLMSVDYVRHVTGSSNNAASNSGASSMSTSTGCPRTCFCNALSQIVYCSRRGLSAIPDGIPADTLQLNLNGNLFLSSSVSRRNFSRNAALQHLYMSECGLERLDVDTFVDLVDLRWLDLSNNRLKVILDYTFRGLTLDHLFLNGNRQIQLEAGSFEGLVTAGLYLHDCSLKVLRVDVLAPLNFTLRNLWINGNEIERIDRSLAGVFSTLQHLRLGSNPLHCGCESVWLMEFYERNADVFKGASQPSCAAPGRLRAKHFNELSLSDFRCQAPVFNNIDIMLSDATGRLKCSATGDPAPTLFWIQPNGRTTKYGPATGSTLSGLQPVSDDGSRRTDGVLTLLASSSGGIAAGAGVVAGAADPVTGMYICVANNDAGNVTLAVNISWPPLPAPNRPLARPTVTTGRASTDPLRIPGQIRIPADDNSLLASRPIDNSAFPVNFTLPGVRGETDWETAGDGELVGGPRLFTVAELICAVVVTHVGTLVISLIFLAIYIHRRASKLRRQQQLLPPLQTTQRAAGVNIGGPPTVGTPVVMGGYRQNGFQLPGLSTRPLYATDSGYDNGTTRSGFSYHVKPTLT